MAPKKQAQKHKTVKELLQAQAARLASSKRTQEPDEDEPVQIKVPRILERFTSIAPSDSSPAYSVSKIARVWFRENSNFDEVLTEFMEQVPDKSIPKEAYTNAVIRAVTSVPLRKLQSPYDKFRFNTPLAESIAHTLLNYPRIRTSQDFNEFEEFKDRNQLLYCQVALGVDPVHADAQSYATKMRRYCPSTEIPVVSKRRLFWSIRRKYFERENLNKNVYLEDLSVQDLEKISNFRKIVEKDKDASLDFGPYDEYAEWLLENFKSDPSKKFAYFTVDPQYNLICNIMTAEQQDEVAADYKTFFRLTSAYDAYKSFENRTNLQDFFDIYRQRNNEDRKLPPFHNLYYKACETELDDATKSTNVASMSKSPSNTERNPTVLKYKTTSRFITNPASSKSMDIDEESSSDISRVTIVQKSMQATEISTKTNSQLPPHYLSMPTPPSVEIQTAVALVLTEKIFAYNAKNDLRSQFPINFDNLWAQNKREILINYFMSFFDGDLKKLLPLLEKCSPKTQESVHVVVYKRLNELYPTTGELRVSR